MMFYPLINKIKKFVKTHVLVDELFVLRQKFKRDDAKLGLRLDYPLNKDSIVFDLGGYRGEWAQKIWERYQPSIYIFEPVPEFYESIVKKFNGNLKIHIFAYGLSDKDARMRMDLKADASSVTSHEQGLEIELRDVASAMKEFAKIDLVKINIEGGEFQVLPRMIETGVLTKCQDIQVQFHHFIPNAEKQREVIRRELEKTHHLTYDYTFTFENWRKNA